MRISINSPKIEITVENEAGEVVYAYQATDLAVEFSAGALIRGIKEYVPTVKEIIAATAGDTPNT